MSNQMKAHSIIIIVNKITYILDIWKFFQHKKVSNDCLTLSFVIKIYSTIILGLFYWLFYVCIYVCECEAFSVLRYCCMSIINHYFVAAMFFPALKRGDRIIRLSSTFGIDVRGIVTVFY